MSDLLDLERVFVYYGPRKICFLTFNAIDTPCEIHSTYCVKNGTAYKEIMKQSSYYDVICLGQKQAYNG